MIRNTVLIIFLVLGIAVFSFGGVSRNTTGDAGVADSASTVADESIGWNKLDDYTKQVFGLYYEPGDTVNVEWFAGSSLDSGWVFEHVSPSDDSLLFYRHYYQTGKGVQALGPAHFGCGDYDFDTEEVKDSSATLFQKQTAYLGMFSITSPGDTMLLGFTHDGSTGDDISALTVENVIQTGDLLQGFDEWEYYRTLVEGDTVFLKVQQTITNRRTDEYFLVKYRFQSNDQTELADTIKAVFMANPRMGGGTVDGLADNDEYDVGYVPGYGEVTHRHLFDDFPYPAFAMLNIGNSEVTEDTLSDGSSAYLSDLLKYDCGSGTEQFLGVGIIFNPANTAKIEQIAFLDTGMTVGWTGACYDSTLSVDSTVVFGEEGTHSRCVVARTEPMYLDLVNWVDLEFAVVKLKIDATVSPPRIYWPMVRWTSGQVTFPGEIGRASP